MAGNIKIVGNILNITTVSRYNEQDNNLISSRTVQENFGGTGDYIEYYIYDVGGNLLNFNYNYLSYKLPPSIGLTPAVSTPPNTTQTIPTTTNTTVVSTLASTTGSLYPIIEIDPIADIQNLGYTSGEFRSRYNFFKNILSNNIDRALFIKEISQDRTEIRLASTTLTNDEIESAVLGMINQINSSSYYVDYLLNFGDNQQYVAVNVALNKANPEGYEVLFKMYQPLPSEILEKQKLWVIEEKTFSYIFNINLDTLIIPPPPPRLRGPNFDIPLPEQGTISTIYTNYNTAIANLQALQSSSYQQLLNLMNTQSIAINVDYTNFNNFVFFGSAYQRISNFYNKVKQIEDYNNFINYYTPYASTTASLLAEINNASASINTLISQFDGFEYYLYFNSGSTLTSSLEYGVTPYPKVDFYLPVVLQSTGSSDVLTWYNWIIENALYYDDYNYDNLVYAVPNFIRDDENNAPFLTFLNMVGQYFDNIWIYLKAITDVNLANNNLNYGISKDLVYNQLQSLGIKLYNSQAGEAVDSFLIGNNIGNNIFDNDFSPTGSYLNNIPRKDLLSELYKRIYHNLPLLLKTKGTKAGLEYLISLFGIPSRTYYTITSGSINTTWYTPTGSLVSESILNIKEYGGGLKSSLIKGYNDEKVRIISNVITGSVLSPLLSLQTFPTNSNEFRENDNHFIDISFSPEAQINTYTSGAIASNNPTWRLDDYIGDPRQLYSETYPDLYEQRKLYYETGVPGYPGFTSSLLDYNGFIRLIQFFDNALFKMLGDFVPERTSLSTGITIESPVLERNKVVYPTPDPLNQEVYDADYPAPTISSPYDDLYYNLGGDKVAYFDGDITGSELNTYAYFEETNFNPYLGGPPNTNWIIYNANRPVNKRISLYKFYHSDYDVLFNNVSKNVDSQFRKKIEYIWGTTGSLTSSVELQDSYLTLQSYNKSRYLGTQLTSKLYNTYTSASYTGSDGITPQNGDISYGLTAVIDRNSYKLGWIQSIPSQSLNFYYKTPTNLRYLIDTKNEVTDLNSYNNNVIEVQNIFKSGKPAIFSITDKNQNKREGSKTVWRGGYRFDPIIYRENKDILTFTFDNYQYTSSAPLGFLLTDNNRYEYETDQIINTPAGDPNYYTPSSIITNTPNKNFFYINDIASLTTSTGQNRLAPEVLGKVAWMERYNDGDILINPNNPYKKIGYNSFAFLTWNSVNSRTQAVGDVYRFDLFKYNSTRYQSSVGRQGFFTEKAPEAFDNNIYITQRLGDYTINAGVNCTVSVLDYDDGPQAGGQFSVFKIALLIERSSLSNYLDSGNVWTNPIIVPVTDYDITFDTFGRTSAAGYDPNTNTIALDSTINTTAANRPSVRLEFNVNTTIPSVPIGTVFRISLYFIDVQDAYQYTDNINIKLSNAYWGVYDSNNITTDYFFDSQYTSSADIFYNLRTTNKTNDTLTIYKPFSDKYFYSASFSGSSPNYSEILDKISVQKGDIIKFGKFQDPGDYYEVIKVNNPSNLYTIVLSDTILPSSQTRFSGSLSNNFAILRPKPDETSIILEGRNALGVQPIETAVLLPYDASTTLINSVGNIIKSVNNYI